MDLEQKIEKSIKILRLAAKMSVEYYHAPLIVTYSGGKDSDVLLNLALDAGIQFEALNSHTTVDAPQTVYHIREVFADLEQRGIKATIKMPTFKGKPTSMWKLIEEKGFPPTRTIRYCCQILKEQTTPHRYIATGVRASESNARRNSSDFVIKGHTRKDAQYFTYDRAAEAFGAEYPDFEVKPYGERYQQYTFNHALEVYDEAHEMPEEWDCNLIKAAKKQKDLVCNPIIEWSDADVWKFIHERGIAYNPLYDMGYTRVGCIGCPLGGTKSMTREFEDFPKYKDAYIRAFERMIEKRAAEGNPAKDSTGQEQFDWWIGNDKTPPGQMEIVQGINGIEIKEHGKGDGDNVQM